MLQTLLVPLLALAPLAPRQDPAGADDGNLSETSRFGAPLVVDGERVPDAEIQRFLCFGLGNKQVEYFKFRTILEQELARRKAQGEDVSRYVVSDEEAERSIEKQRKDFLLKYPTLDFPTEVGRAFLSLDLYRQQSRQAQVFDKLFLPENPDEWPVVTIEALRAGGLGDMWIEDAKQSYERRKQMQIEKELDEIPADDPIFVDTLRQTVIAALDQFATVDKDPAKLPAGVLMTVEGVPVTIEEVFSQIAPHVTPRLVEDAKRFIALRELLAAELAEKGALMPKEEFEATFQGQGDTYQQKLQNHMMLALQVLGMPSMEAYETYARLMKSYERVIADLLADDAKLAEYKPAADLIAGAAKVDAQVILVSAFDFDEVEWKEDGWAQAKERAAELKKQLDEGADWTAVLELHSEFWDPPMPEVGQKPQYGFRFKGKFGPQTRNQLLGYMGENDYTMFIRGPSVTDYVFFEQPVGTIQGPMEGPHGYYISRVTGRTPPSRPLDMSQPTHRDFVEQHALKINFHKEAQRLLEEGRASGRVKGI